MGWRLRALVVLALIGCIGLFALLRMLAQGPHLDLAVRQVGSVGLELVATGHPELLAKTRSRLVKMDANGVPGLLIDGTVQHHSPRWAVHDRERDLILVQQHTLSQLVARDTVDLHFADGSAVTVRPQARGLGGLGATFWLLSALALALYLIAAVVYLSRPCTKNLLYAVMAMAQSANLLLMAVESAPGWGLPIGFVGLDFRLRTLLDLITACAILQVALTHPRRVPAAGKISAAMWLATICFGSLAINAGVPDLWWWTQSLLIAQGLIMWAIQT
jgi:hypothetical protein